MQHFYFYSILVALILSIGLRTTVNANLVAYNCPDSSYAQALCSNNTAPLDPAAKSFVVVKPYPQDGKFNILCPPVRASALVAEF
ncbi:hypothetical protein PCANC_03461 [Puccinia coronata f. sp. avenae]|uniref:Uncharacterized protein n=1 Tax=Puccinia coronata f. sp. avenae TaxID=200324 RepID=A0A2N5W2A0_9BASI|nr:hypothetical protein PCANC_03461 [Puccinia coronata f. sp. avenae]